MKTTYFRTNGICILFSVTALLFSAFISSAQINVSLTGGVSTYTVAAPSSGLLVGNGNVGIGTISPNSKLSISESASTTLTDYTQALTKAGLNIVTNYTTDAYTPGLIWSTSDNNSSKPKAGVFMKETGSGSLLYFGTSNSYSTGITNNALVIDPSGNVGIGVTNPANKLQVGSMGSTGYGSNAIAIGDGTNVIAMQYGSTGYIVANGSLALGGGGNVTNQLFLTSGGNIGIGDATPSYNLEVNGTTYCNNTWQSSDVRFKKNITAIEGALDKITRMNGKSYEFRTDEFKERRFSKGRDLGLIAQELKEILPEAVHLDTTDGYYSINYIAVIPVIIEAMKEQDSIIKAQSLKIDNLQTLVTDCCNSSMKMDNGNNTNGTGNNTTGGINNNSIPSSMAILYQNTPNPFSLQTNIQYQIPVTSQNASIMVFDLNGKLIKTFPITNFGNSAITINGNELSPGMFVYSLIVDGKIIDTKRMILTL